MNFYDFNEVEYRNSVATIKSIAEKEKCCCDSSKFCLFLREIASSISNLCDLEEKLNDEYFKSKSFEELLEENHKLYEPIRGENYKTSYCNPSYAVEVFGEELGKVASMLANKYRGYIKYAFLHKKARINAYNKLFLDLYNHVINHEANAEQIKNVIFEFEKSVVEFEVKERLSDLFINTGSYIKTIVENEDLSDLRYLFKYGEYISDNEIKTAKFLNNYDKIDTIANTVCEAYISGFKRDNKDYTKKSTALLIVYAGQEQITRALIKKLKAYGLDSIVPRADTTDANKQLTYDHRFDIGLFFNKEYADLKIEASKKKLEEFKEDLAKYSGILVFESFGEIPFTPESKKEALKLSEEQSVVFQEHNNNIRREQDKYLPEAETSFTIIAFPTPEIGEKFEEIFEDTLEINMLDSKKYEVIQQKIIDVLDKGEFVHVKGKGTNKTDIMVKMHELKNPEKETNFENCVADVNIPVGEVFTSPVLKDTNGILHVEEVYLDDLKYNNLELKFKDGFIEEYTCTNFEEEEENKKYIQENLLFPNKTLPLGEFAIGTNTLAYVIAQKHGIVNLLPILIVEKMGPHFAVGDTCFSFSEDLPVYNPDNKEIVARDNEKSILRKTNPQEAYTGCHTDITLPYDGLEFISVITKDGDKVDIIRDGRFVVEGTEELNKVFE